MFTIKIIPFKEAVKRLDASGRRNYIDLNLNTLEISGIHGIPKETWNRIEDSESLVKDITTETVSVPVNINGFKCSLFIPKYTFDIIGDM